MVETSDKFNAAMVQFNRSLMEEIERQEKGRE
jgi:hypothetical protein